MSRAWLTRHPLAVTTLQGRHSAAVNHFPPNTMRGWTEPRSRLDHHADRDTPRLREGSGRTQRWVPCHHAIRSPYAATAHRRKRFCNSASRQTVIKAKGESRVDCRLTSTLTDVPKSRVRDQPRDQLKSATQVTTRQGFRDSQSCRLGSSQTDRGVDDTSLHCQHSYDVSSVGTFCCAEHRGHVTARIPDGVSNLRGASSATTMPIGPRRNPARNHLESRSLLTAIAIIPQIVPTMSHTPRKATISPLDRYVRPA